LLIVKQIDNMSLKSRSVYSHTQYKILGLWRGVGGRRLCYRDDTGCVHCWSASGGSCCGQRRDL